MEPTVVQKRKMAVTPERRTALGRRLLAALEELLAEGTPYPDLTVEALIRRAGVSRGTFYSHFDDKGALLSTIADEVVGQLIQSSSMWWDLPEVASRETLLKRLSAAVELFSQHVLLFRALADTAGQDAQVLAKLRGLVDLSTQAFAAALLEGQERNRVRGTVDVEAVAEWLVWMAERGLVQILQEVDDVGRARSVEAMADILWYTLYDVGPT